MTKPIKQLEPALADKRRQDKERLKKQGEEKRNIERADNKRDRIGWAKNLVKVWAQANSENRLEC
jgi:hypothetical protein